MFFSIIIPVYNVGQYLEKCIESILEQDFEKYEVILVDDGSTDNSGQICDLYATEYTNVKVIHKKNGGLSDARNCGTVASRGKYIIFIDGDDYCNKNFLDNLYNCIKKNEEPDIILCNGFFQFEDGTNHLISKLFGLEEYKINNLNGEQVLEYLFRNKKYSNWSWSACFNIYKAEYWKNNNFNFKVGKTCEDAELIPKTILLSSKCILFKENYYCYRLNRSGSIMDIVSEKRLYDMLDIAKYWIDYSNEFLYNKKLSSAIKSKYSDEAFRYIKYINNFNKESRKEMVELFKKNGYSTYIEKPNFKLYRMLVKVIGYNNVSKIMVIESKVLFYIKNNL